MAKFDIKLEEVTSGKGDVTLATQITKAFKEAFDNSVGFSIETPNGMDIAQDMREKIQAVFEKNIDALQVKFICQGW